MLPGDGDSSVSGRTSLEALERSLAAALGTEYAVVTGSGRSALEIALRSLAGPGGSTGGTVLCSDFTCSIVPQTIARAGFRPAFVDVDRDLSFNIGSIQSLPADCRAIVLNYLYGCPRDNVDQVREFVRRHGIHLIEDVAQSFGAILGGVPAGSLGDVGVFSFPKLFFNLRRGGCLVTSQPDLAARARVIRSRVETPFPSEAVRFARRLANALAWRLAGLKEKVRPTPDPFTNYQARPYRYFEETHPSLRWALSDREADSCASSLRNLDSSKRDRARLVKTMLGRLDEGLNGLFTLPAPYDPGFVYSKIPLICHRFDRRTLKPLVESAGVPVEMDYIPLHNNLHLRGTSLAISGSSGYAVSEYYAQHLLPVPVGPGIHEGLLKALGHLCWRAHG